ncbi:MAG: hypothetical protein NTW19_03500 [Planctomycetota bacterium]|nr:hypothetical protein [Planctomycetota bacterium]
MTLQLPDPVQAARDEAERINANRAQFLEFPIDRVLTDAPWVKRQDLTAGLADFHRERMAKIPSKAAYPEAAPWIESALARDRELKAQAKLSDEEMAVFRSLVPYITFRGFKQAGLALKPRPATDEKCRSAYIPDTDRGEVAIKNVDDPLTHWKPDPKPLSGAGPLPDLRSDGVGNGLHMDDEPDELFPIPVMSMLRHHANDVPSAVQFLTRYRKFWGGSNLLLHDKQKRSAAVEKCSYSHIEVFHPGPDGRSHISGMTCRDANSPQGKFQASQRRKYVDLFKLPLDGPDMTFWAGCAKFEAKLSAGLAALGPRPRWDDLLKLFITRWPEGLNKYGLRLHPNQGLVGYTLIIHASLITERKSLRWQRSEDGKTFDAQPQECSY